MAHCESLFLGLLGAVSGVTWAPALVAASVELSSGQGPTGRGVRDLGTEFRPRGQAPVGGVQA